MQSFVKKILNLNIDLTVDSSELLMMNKGGKHSCELNLKDIMKGIDLETMNVNTTLTIQMPIHHQKRFDHVTADAKPSFFGNMPTL